MFPIANFFAIIHTKNRTQMIKNKNLPFVRTKNQNILNVQIKTAECNLFMRNKSYL